MRRLTTSKLRDKPKKSLSLTLFFLPILLSIIGLFFVFEASYVRSFQENQDSFHYLKVQSLWILIGISSMVFFSYFDYHKWYYIAFGFMMVTLVLLLMVLLPGIGHKVGGARRWIDLGFTRFQPTEMAKLTAIIYLSSWFITKERKRFFSFVILLGLLMLLIIMQPDMGTAVIIFLLSIILYYLAGIELYYLLLLIPVSAVSFYLLAKTTPYRFKRILAFFDPNADPLGITYHINQILISLSNGGFFGVGFGGSKQKYLYLPEAHTDSIFAIIAEEVGFVGCFFLLSLFIVLIYHLYLSAQNAPDRYGNLMAGGIFAFFAVQSLVNLGSMVHLIPLTGVPLPFFSYGGSNLLLCFTLIGITINIARQGNYSGKIKT